MSTYPRQHQLNGIYSMKRKHRCPTNPHVRSRTAHLPDRILQKKIESMLSTILPQRLATNLQSPAANHLPRELCEKLNKRWEKTILPSRRRWLPKRCTEDSILWKPRICHIYMYARQYLTSVSYQINHQSWLSRKLTKSKERPRTSICPHEEWEATRHLGVVLPLHIL